MDYEIFDLTIFAIKTKTSARVVVIISKSQLDQSDLPPTPKQKAEQRIPKGGNRVRGELKRDIKKKAHLHTPTKVN